MNSTMVWLWVQVHHSLLGILLVVLLVLIGLVEWVKIMREERFREKQSEQSGGDVNL